MIWTIGISAGDLPRTAAMYSPSILPPDKNNRGVLHSRQGQDRDPHLDMGKDRESDRHNRKHHLAMGKLDRIWVRAERQDM